jgi:uncharacterized membrane protein YccC
MSTLVDVLVPWLHRVQWKRGYRAAAAIGSAILVTHLLGLPALAAAAALGAYNPLVVDNGGPYRTRLASMLTATVGGALVYIAGALVPQRLVALLIATMFVAFAITFARVLSQPFASSSVVVLVVYFAGLGGSIHTPREASLIALLIFAGGIWSITLSLGFWPLDPFRPARLSVASCYRWMSQFTAGLDQEAGLEVESADPGFEWRRQQRIRIEQARAALGATAARAPSRTIRSRNLTVLLETSDMLLARTMRLAEFHATASRLELEASRQLAGDISHWLARAENVIADALEQRPPAAAASFSRDGSHRLEFVTRRQQLLLQRKGVADDPLYLHLLREERDALLELEIAFDAVRALWTGTETPSSNYASTVASELPPGWLEAAKTNWTMKSAAFRHALRMMVVGGVDVVAMHLLTINHGFWLPMTSIILLQPFSAGTVRKSVQRVAGTVAGGILAALLALTVTNPAAMLIVVTLLAALAVATFAVDYAVFCFFLTPTFVLLNLPHARDWQFALVRIGTTFAGATIAVLAMRLLWPERADVELAGLLRRGSDAAAQYLQAMLDFWQLAPATRKDAERTLLTPARRACGLASNDAEEAVDRVMQEPTLGRASTAETMLRNEALTFITYLRRLTQSITTLALVGVDTSATRLRLQPVAASLARVAKGSAAPSARATAETPAWHIDVAEEQMQRIERQTAVLERAAGALWHAASLEPLAPPQQQQHDSRNDQRSA